MLNALVVIYDQIMRADSLVWSLALLMSGLFGMLLHSYLDDWTATIVAMAGMYIAVLVGSVAFSQLGLVFSHNKDSNIVAAAGAGICTLTLAAVILRWTWLAICNLRYGSRQ
jgi:hypothetical protein